MTNADSEFCLLAGFHFAGAGAAESLAALPDPGADGGQRRLRGVVPAADPRGAARAAHAPNAHDDSTSASAAATAAAVSAVSGGEGVLRGGRLRRRGRRGRRQGPAVRRLQTADHRRVLPERGGEEVAPELPQVRGVRRRARRAEIVFHEKREHLLQGGLLEVRRARGSQSYWDRDSYLSHILMLVMSQQDCLLCKKRCA